MSDSDDKHLPTDPLQFCQDLGLAQLALQLTEGISDHDDGATNGLNGQDFVDALRTAKSLVALAGQAVDEVEIYQVFDDGVFMSCEEIAKHLGDHCAWPSLDTVYLVEIAVDQVLADVHDEIQSGRQRFKRAARQKSGSLVDVTEAEGTIRRALHGLLSGTSIGELLGTDAEDALRLGTDCVMARVHELLGAEEALQRPAPRVTGEFFTDLCDGGTYESYLGHHGDSNTVSFESLRGMLESLASRFEEGFSKEPGDVHGQLRRIDRWLTGQTFLQLGDSGVFTRTLETLERLDAEGDGDETDNFSVQSRFSEELNLLADKWAVRGILDRVGIGISRSLVERIEKLLMSYHEVGVRDANDEDEQSRYREFPHCVDAVLRWLSGVRVRPRTFYHHIGIIYRTGTGGSGPASLENVALKRIAEFQACLQELDLCLDGTFLPDDESGEVKSEIKEVDSLLYEQRQVVTLPSESLREAARSRATDLLDSICAKRFKHGNINARLLFEYTARRGIRKLGQKGDQALVAKRSDLNRGCVVAPATIHSRSER